MCSSWSGGRCEAKKTQDNTSTSCLGADCSQWPPPDPCTFDQGCNREIPEHPEDLEPLEGSWMSWSTWGGCSLSCGKGGLRTRSRHCMSCTPCHGPWELIEPCLQEPCLQEPCFGEFPSNFIFCIKNLQFDIFVIFSVQLFQNIKASLMAVVESLIPDLFNILQMEEWRQFCLKISFAFRNDFCSMFA